MRIGFPDWRIVPGRGSYKGIAGCGQAPTGSACGPIPDREVRVAFTPEAQALWDRVPEEMRAKLLDSGFCTFCLATRRFELLEAEIRGHELALIGKCGTCGHRVVRNVEIGG